MSQTGAREATVTPEPLLEKDTSPKLYERLACEFIGTFFLVMAVGVGVASTSNLAPVAIGLTLAVQVYTFGPVSGGMFNPAVTISVLLSGREKIAIRDAALYIFAQLAGGVLGALAALGQSGQAFFFHAPQRSIISNWLLEILFTMALCKIVLAAGTSKDHPEDAPNHYYGFAIGSTVLAGALALGGFDQGSFNPAVTIGMNIASAVSGADHAPVMASWLLYAFAPIIGGALAAAVFRGTRGHEYGDHHEPQTREKLLAELVGTFFLVLTVGVSVAGGGKLAPVAIGLMLAVQIYSFGSVSMAFLNPAVTVAVLLSGRDKITVKDAAMYIAAQFVGAILAACIAFFTTQKTFAFEYGQTQGWATSLELEILWTMALAGAVLATGTSKDTPNQYFGFAIGCSVLGAALASSWHVDQCSLNPAVTLGINLANLMNSDADIFPSTGSWFVFIFAPVLGGGLAAAVFRGTRGGEYTPPAAPGAKQAVPEPKLHEKLLAEFVGTFFLMLTIGVCVVGKVLLKPVAIGLNLAVQIYTFGPVSGAHLNPAVTLAVLLSGNRDSINGEKIKEACAYVVSQILGAIAAALCAFFATGRTFYFDYRQTHSWNTSMGLEILFTTALGGIVLAAAVSKDARTPHMPVDETKNQYFGFAIGSAVLASVLACSGHIDQGSFNPAVTVAANLASLADTSSALVPNFGSWLLFTLSPCLGGAAAAGIYHLTRTKDGESEKPLGDKLIAELVGTFFLVLTVGVSCVGGVPYAAVAIGLMLAVQVYTFASVSGACLNPAVTLAVLLSGRNKLDAKTAGAYVGAQLLGGLLAGFAAFAVTGRTFVFNFEHEFSIFTSFGLESLFTLVLCGIVLAAGTSKDAPNQYFGFAIGCAVMAGALDSASFDQGSFNPAVTFGVNIANYFNFHGHVPFPSFASWCLFVFAPLFGGSLAAAVFRGVRSREYAGDYTKLPE